MQRKKPFSGKQKKEQLQLKRDKKKKHMEESSSENEPVLPSASSAAAIAAVQQQLQSAARIVVTTSSGQASLRDLKVSDPKVRADQLQGQSALRNLKSALWDEESRGELEARKVAATFPLDLSLRPTPEEWARKKCVVVPMPLSSVVAEGSLPIPKRPKWRFDTTVQQLEQKEHAMFKAWLEGILKEHPGRTLNYFECNLETWRQLWRVCERSHVLLYLVDARFALFQFSNAIHQYVTQDLRKPFILVLNKADLVEEETLQAWEKWFREKVGITNIVRFSAFSSSTSSDDPRNQQDAGMKGTKFENRKKLATKAKKMPGGRYANPKGREELLQIVRKIAHERYGEDLERLRAADEGDSGERLMGAGYYADTSAISSAGEGAARARHAAASEAATAEAAAFAPRDRTVVVGTIGNPNVGKSSLINGLSLKKIVSVSRTPGHTKHFQTHRLAADILLCDCPGMVFPALDRPKTFQVLCGLYPLPHLREPFTALRYIAERVPLEKLYQLEQSRDEGVTKEQPWSALEIAEALARKRGYLTGRTGRPDEHRATREILSDFVDGFIPLCWSPPTEGSGEQRRKEDEAEEQLLAAAFTRLRVSKKQTTGVVHAVVFPPKAPLPPAPTTTTTTTTATTTAIEQTSSASLSDDEGGIDFYESTTGADDGGSEADDDDEEDDDESDDDSADSQSDASN